MATEPVQLNPSIPSDAIQIIDILTRDITMTRSQAQGLIQAIQTLDGLVTREAQAALAAQGVEAEAAPQNAVPKTAHNKAKPG